MEATRTTSQSRIYILIGVTTLYILFIILFGSILGSSIANFAVLPTVVVAYLFGVRGGIVVWLVAMVFNTALLNRFYGYDSAQMLFSSERIVRGVVLLFLALMLGYIHELGNKLRAELNRRQFVESVERQRSAELEAVYNASVQLTSTLELKPVLELILQQVSALVNPQRIYLFLYEGEKLTFGTFFSQIVGQTPDRELRSNGLTYAVARSGKRIVVSDFRDHPLYADTTWDGAIVGLPLTIGDRVYGVMNVSYDIPRAFDENELRILDVLASQAAIALRNANAYEHTRSYAEALEKRVEERTVELSNAKERAEAILNNSYDAILLIDANGIIQQTNKTYNRLFAQDHGIGHDLAGLFKNPQTIRDTVRAVVADHSIVELEETISHERGDLIADLAFVPFDNRTDDMTVICTIRDVTERRRGELRQQVFTQGLRKVLALTSDLISTPDMDSMWKRAVEALRTELGIERCAIFLEHDGYMRGTFGTDRYGNTVDERDQRWLRTGWGKAREHMFSLDAPLWEVAIEDQREWKDGQAITVDRGWVVMTPIQSAYRFVGILVNDAMITKAPLDEIQQEIVAVFCSFLGSLYEHKRVEEEMRRALEREKELNELKSRFTSMISHELRTPLASIQLSSELLMRYYSQQTEEARHKHLEKIRGQVKHMTSMIEDVLTFSNAEQVGLQFQPRIVDLRGLCAEISAEIRLTNPDHPIEFTVTGAENWRGEIDPKLMRQAVTNLLLNAVKYSDADTTISFMLERDQQDAVLRVVDHGIGIPEVDRARIFDVFYRAQNASMIAGMGLGLAMVRQIAGAHKGLVVCESEMNVGTTFIFRIPFFNEA